MIIHYTWSNWLLPWPSTIMQDDWPSLSVVEEPSTDELEIPFVRDQHLRVTNGDVEDDYIEFLIKASNLVAHDETRRSLQQQTLSYTLDAFPLSTGWIELPRPPLQEVTALSYIDDAGDEQQLAVSPADFVVLAPQGPKAARGRIAPLAGASWPSTQSGRLGAVTITYTAGYETLDKIPRDITWARLAVIGEMYKQRSESVIGAGLTMTKAYRAAKDVLMKYRVYGSP